MVCFLGVDDAVSECGLDSGVAFDIVIDNDNNQELLHSSIEKLITTINQRLH